MGKRMEGRARGDAACDMMGQREASTKNVSGCWGNIDMRASTMGVGRLRNPDLEQLTKAQAREG